MIKWLDCNRGFVSFNVLLSINLIIPALENETKMKLKKKILQQQDVRYHFLSSVDQCGTRMSFRVCVFLWQEKQKKLWHAPYYDSEMKLKQQYIKICKNLPTFGCKLYQVKELLRGNAQKKVSGPRMFWIK